MELVAKGLENDAASKGQRLSREGFEVVRSEGKVQLLGASHFKYLVLGRGPGKQPPPERMLKFVQETPGLLEDARKTYEKITEKQLAFLIGRSIGQRGTRIFRGEKKGLDLLGVMEQAGLDELLDEIAYNEAVNVSTILFSDLDNKIGTA